MKRIIFTTFILTFACSFFFINGLQPAMAGEKSKYGGILKANHAKSADVIGNPLNIRAHNHEFIVNTLQTLIKPSNNEMGVFIPMLATSWELAPDKSSITFKLRKGVKFHDGTPFNAKAAKWNLDMWVKSKRHRLDNVSSVDTIDEHTIRCNLKGWDAATLMDFAREVLMISPTAWEKNGVKWVNFHPVGTGPFKFKEYNRKVHLKFEKFDDYWEEGLPYLDGITFNHIADPMTSIASLKRGKVDVLMDTDAITASQLKNSKGFKVTSCQAINELIQFNSIDPKSPWSDKRMREALEYALDKERLANVVGRGLFVPAYQILCNIPEGAGTTPRKYNPDKARQLIKTAGYENLSVKFAFPMSPHLADTVVAIQANLADVGIKVDPAPVLGPAFAQYVFRPVLGPDLVIGFIMGSKYDVLGSAEEMFSSGSIFFRGLKKAPGFYDYLNQALQQEDVNDSLKYLWKMEKLAYDDAMFVPIYRNTLNVVQSSKLNDAEWFWAQRPFPNLERAWLSK